MEGKKFKFKTSINCGGCIAAVTPKLNSLEGIEEWSVDTANPDKILTINSVGASEEEIIETVKNAGYSIESID